MNGDSSDQYAGSSKSLPQNKRSRIPLLYDTAHTVGACHPIPVKIVLDSFSCEAGAWPRQAAGTAPSASRSARIRLASSWASSCRSWRSLRAGSFGRTRPSPPACSAKKRARSPPRKNRSFVALGGWAHGRTERTGRTVVRASHVERDHIAARFVENAAFTRPRAGVTFTSRLHTPTLTLCSPSESAPFRSKSTARSS